MAHVRLDVRGGREARGFTPPDWAADQLAAFMDMASDNVLGTFAQVRRHYDDVLQVDSAYVTFMNELLDPADPIAPLFILQAHASYRAAAGLAMSCQSPPAFMVMRGCLETSLYGLYFNRHPEAFDIWLRRHDDEEARRRVKTEFTIRRLKDRLEDVDPATHAVAAQLYEKTIDFGGHPNVASMAAAFRTSRGEGVRRMHVIYLTTDLEVVSGTMKSIAQTGVCSLLIFRNIFPERFDLLGITDSLTDLRGRL